MVGTFSFTYQKQVGIINATLNKTMVQFEQANCKNNPSNNKQGTFW
jgi:hypothetical protein